MDTKWYLAIRRDYEIQTKFEKIWVDSECPKDAVLLGGHDPITGTIDFYFNPGAAKISTELLVQYRAVECPEPDVVSLAPLVGDLPNAGKIIKNADLIPFKSLHVPIGMNAIFMSVNNNAKEKSVHLEHFIHPEISRVYNFFQRT